MTTASPFMQVAASGFPEAWKPNLDAGERAQVSRVAPRPAALLMWHRERWGVVRGKLRPILGRLKLIPGVSNVELGPRGSIRIGRAKAHYEERGWTVIPAETLPPSQAHRGSYLCRPPGRPDVTLCYWEQVFAGSGAMRCDDEALDEFLDHLIDSGVIALPETYVLERLRDEANQEAEVAADKAQTVPSYKPIAKAAADRVKVLDKILKDRLSETPQAASAVLPEVGD